MHSSRCKQTDITPAHIVTDSGPPSSIMGIGIDLIKVDRFVPHLACPDLGPIPALFTPREIARCRARPRPTPAFPRRLAAHDAVVKALVVTGGRGRFWPDIEIRDDEPASPEVALPGRARELATAAGIRRIPLSHDHTRDYAAACAVASR